MHKVIILGSGCAGLAAAIYTARANLSPLLIAGPLFGGQLSQTTIVENYPGFPEGIMGPDLMLKMKEQAEKFGTTISNEEVVSVDFSKTPFTIITSGETLVAQAVIIATGATAKMLGVPGEQEYFGKGVSTCATCDGYFYRNKQVAIVGGGDSAMEESLLLTHFASKVFLIHRRDQLRASKIMQERAYKNEKMVFVWNTVVNSIVGEPDKGVIGLNLKNIQTAKEHFLPVDGFFLAIGHTPNTAIFKGQLDMDEQGYLITDRRQHTKIPGVFGAGDVQDHIYRQAATASGSGVAAAIEVERYLERQ